MKRSTHIGSAIVAALALLFSILGLAAPANAHSSTPVMATASSSSTTCTFYLRDGSKWNRGEIQANRFYKYPDKKELYIIEFEGTFNGKDDFFQGYFKLYDWRTGKLVRPAWVGPDGNKYAKPVYGQMEVFSLPQKWPQFYAADIRLDRNCIRSNPILVDD